jgi:hypothetical protein
MNDSEKDVSSNRNNGNDSASRSADFDGNDKHAGYRFLRYNQGE